MKQNDSNNEELDLKKEYAKSWEKDSIIMNSNKLYDWMSSNIENYKNILEIGCGAGYSTLNLLRKGHNVTCIEFNKNFIDKTKRLLNENGYRNIEILNEQISEVNCVDIVKKIKSKVDLVICWNRGGIASLSNKERGNKLEELLRNGYSQDINLIIDPINTFAIYYAEDLIRSALKIGEVLKIDAHIIDRADIQSKTLDEYLNIKEYGYNKFIYNKIEGMSNEKTMGISTEMFFESYLLLR